MTATDDQLENDSRRDELLALSKRLGYAFEDLTLLDRALTHSSLGNEGKKSYERLEFLGDAFLNFAVAEVVFAAIPEVAEGQLTETRSNIVSRTPLATIADELGLAQHLLSGKGLREEETRSARIRADLVEAVLGAILVDGGIRPARAFVRRHCLPADEPPKRQKEPSKDAKTALLHYCQHVGLGQPRYELVETTGLQHEQQFRARARIEDGRHADGLGRTKRAAEKVAAAALLDELQADADA